MQGKGPRRHTRSTLGGGSLSGEKCHLPYIGPRYILFYIPESAFKSGYVISNSVDANLTCKHEHNFSAMLKWKFKIARLALVTIESYNADKQQYIICPSVPAGL